MKYAFRISVLVLLTAFLPAKAVPFTTSLNELSNIVAQAYEGTADLPKAHALLGKALADFEKPSESVSGDYNIFLSVAMHLMPLTRMQGAGEISFELLTVSSNVFAGFAFEAITQSQDVSNRVASLSNFQRNKRPAANQVRAAMRALDLAQATPSIQLSMLSIRLAFLKIALAEKLAAKAELNPDYAPDSLAGRVLTHAEGESNGGTVTFTSETEYTETDNEPGAETRSGTYTYAHNGLNSGYLVLTGSSNITKVRMIYTGEDAGTFTAVNTTPEKTERQAGTFTLSPAP